MTVDSQCFSFEKEGFIGRRRHYAHTHCAVQIEAFKDNKTMCSVCGEPCAAGDLGVHLGNAALNNSLHGCCLLFLLESFQEFLRESRRAHMAEEDMAGGNEEARAARKAAKKAAKKAMREAEETEEKVSSPHLPPETPPL